MRGNIEKIHKSYWFVCVCVILISIFASSVTDIRKLNDFWTHMSLGIYSSYSSSVIVILDIFSYSVCVLSYTCVYRLSTKVSSLKCSSWLILSHLSMFLYRSNTADLFLASPYFAKAEKCFQVVKLRNSRIHLLC